MSQPGAPIQSVEDAEAHHQRRRLWPDARGQPGDRRSCTMRASLTSTSLMATAPAVEDAIDLARQNPGLGVGCHLNFVEGSPAAHPESIPTLLGADGKTFRPSMADFAQAVLRGSVVPEEIALETQAQIQRLQRAGIDVTHVDTHKHTHVFPLIARTIVHIAQRCGVHAIRNPYEPRWSQKLAHCIAEQEVLPSCLQSSRGPASSSCRRSSPARC